MLEKKITELTEKVKYYENVINKIRNELEIYKIHYENLENTCNKKILENDELKRRLNEYNQLTSNDSLYTKV